LKIDNLEKTVTEKKPIKKEETSIKLRWEINGYFASEFNYEQYPVDDQVRYIINYYHCDQVVWELMIFKHYK
jgi:hypothetical protein